MKAGRRALVVLLVVLALVWLLDSILDSFADAQPFYQSLLLIEFSWGQIVSRVFLLLSLLTAGLVGMVMLRRSRRAQGELRASRNLLANIIDQSPFSTWIADASGTAIRQNAACRELLGIERDEQFLGQYNLLRDPQIIRAGLSSDIQAVFAQGRTARFTLDYDIAALPGLRLPHARKRTLSFVIFPVRDAAGQVVNAVIQHDDLTDQLAAQQARRQVEERFRLLVESVQEYALFLLDADGRIDSWNTGAERTYGYTEQEILGANISKLYRPEDVAAGGHTEALRLARETGHTREEGWCVRKNGQQFWAETVTDAMQEEGRFRGYVRITRDRTERRQAEQAIRASEARLSTIFNASPVAIDLTTADDGRFLDINPSFLNLLGYSREEVIGRTALELGIWPDAAARQEALRDLFASGHLRDAELSFRNRQGQERTVLLSAELIEINGQKCVLSLLRDVTERKLAEEALRQSEEKYRTLADFTFDWEYWLGADGRYIYISPACRRVTGYDPADFILDPDLMFQITHPDDQAMVRAHYGQSLAGNAEPAVLDFRIIDRAGQVHWINHRCQPVYDLQGVWRGRRGTNIDFTTRHQAEEELRLTKFSVDHSAESAFWIGPDADILYVNDAAARALGYSRDELLKMKVFDFDPVYDPRQWPADWQTLKARGTRTIETKHRARDGRVYPVEVSSNYFEFSGRQYNFAFVRDISERVRTQETLRESENRHRSLFESMTQGVVYYDDEGRVIGINPAASRILGAGLDQMLGRAPTAGDWRAIHEDGTPIEPAQLPSAVAVATGQKAGPTVIGVFNARDSQIHWLSVYAVPQFKPGQTQPWRVYVIFDDITQRRHAESALKEEHDFATSLIETAQAIVMVLDVQGRIVRLNRFGRDLAGYAEPEAVGQSAFELLLEPEYHPLARERFDAILHGRASPGTLIPVRTRAGAKAMVRWYESPMINAAGEVTGMLVIGHDVTELLAKQDQLQQAAKMEAIGRLSGGIAHDFNNVLAVIQGYADLLAKGMPSTDPRLADVNSIRDASRRASGLVRQLLTFARRQAVQLQVMSLGDSIESMQSMLQRILGAEITLTRQVAPDLWPVKADPSQVEQILLNMAVNAHDAMPTGGTLRIDARNTTLDAEYARTHADVSPGDYAMIAVSDNGPGMPPEVRAHIFEPFFTTKPDGKGTGLGLTTVYAIVKQSGGHINVYSEPGHGAVFRIYLPRHRAEQEPAPAAGTVAGAPTAEAAPAIMPRGTETILLAEDEAPVRALVRRVLGELGYALLEASGGREALQLAGAPDQKIDLLITDVNMPDLRGPDLVERLRAARPDLRVLFISGYTSHVAATDGVPGPNFLAKPFAPAQLAQAIRKALDS